MRSCSSPKLKEQVKKGEKAEGMKFIEGGTTRKKDDMKGHRIHDVKFANN